MNSEYVIVRLGKRERSVSKVDVVAQGKSWSCPSVSVNPGQVPSPFENTFRP